MCEKFLFVAVFVAFAHLTDAASAPFITKCRWSDSKCIKQSTLAVMPTFFAGIPELGVESLDPVFQKNIDASNHDLKFLLSDVTIAGLKDCVPKKIQRDKPNSKILVKALCNVVLDGQYEVSGRILIIPIEGKGKIHVVLRKLFIDVEANLGEKIKDGITHWDIKSWKHTFELRDKSDIDLEGLFDGNENLARAVRSLLTTNGNDVVNEVGPAIIRAIITRIVKNINRLFHRVPGDELSID